MPNDFNQQVIEEFRANKGRVGGYFEGARLLLLTTTGARTGRPHTTPVGYLPDSDDRVLIIASAAGAPRHPAWFHNLVANPRVTVESGAFTYEARAVVIEGEERDRIFARAVEADPGWAAYQEKTERVIPVIALHSLAEGGPGHINASSMGEALKVVHDAFRRELELIRAEMNDKAGTGRSTLGAQLRVNCLTFCAGLHNHHTGEASPCSRSWRTATPSSRPRWPGCGTSTTGSPNWSRTCAGSWATRTPIPTRPAARSIASRRSWRRI